MDIQRVVQHLKDSVPGLLAIYVFGSHVSGDLQPHSDLDVAIYLPGKGDPLALWGISGELADIVDRPVDLIDLGAASTVMQYQIITQGRCVWSRDVSSGLFEAFVLSEKTALDASRAGLIDDIQKDGLIHG